MNPYDKGYFEVSDGHSLYYEWCGNQRGIPLLFLHGGPGSGFVETHKTFFDFDQFNVLFFDQRGSGRSQPFGSIKANTTRKLVLDIQKLLDHFAIDKIVFYGGSWGSTLALTYAIQHPKRVLGLVLRGIFLGTLRSIDYYLGGGVKERAPKIWERFVKQVPKEHLKSLSAFYYRKMKSKNHEIRHQYRYEWARYELMISQLQISERDIEDRLNEYSYESLALLEAHFLNNRCFLPNNYILQNAAKLSGIPVTIVHGRYDLICSPNDAFKLHKRIKNSRLHLVCAGHAATEPATKDTLFTELAWIKEQLQGKRRPFDELQTEQC